MKPSPISVAMLVVSLFLSPALLAQSPDSANQNAASPSPAASAAEVPRLIKFSGTLLDAQDRPMAGPVGVTFALHAQQTGGAALWIETQNVTPDAHGSYTVLLGANSANGVPAELFASGEARWLEVQVEQQAEQPRVLLVSVPYALKAGDAQTLGGKPASAYALSGPGAALVAGTTGAAVSASSTGGTPQPAVACTSVTSDGTAALNSIAMFTAPCAVQSSVITESGSNVGIGTAAPAVALDIVGNNAGLRLSGTGTHQVTVTGLSSGRLGQDATGFFFSSDSNGKVIKFLTNNGTLNEWMRITSAGNVGIGTTTPAQKLSVAGMLESTTGGYKFPDGTIQTTASFGGGGGTITGVTAGTGLSGGGTAGNVTLNLASNACAAGQALTALPFTCTGVATTGANTFTGNQMVTGNISDTGNLSVTGTLTGTSANLTGLLTGTSVNLTGTLTGTSANLITNSTSSVLGVTQNGTGMGIGVNTGLTSGDAIRVIMSGTGNGINILNNNTPGGRGIKVLTGTADGIDVFTNNGTGIAVDTTDVGFTPGGTGISLKTGVGDGIDINTTGGDGIRLMTSDSPTAIPHAMNIIAAGKANGIAVTTGNGGGEGITVVSNSASGIGVIGNDATANAQGIGVHMTGAGDGIDVTTASGPGIVANNGGVAINPNNLVTGAAVYGQTNSSAIRTEAIHGVALSDATFVAGVRGGALGTTMETVGVLGFSFSSIGYGVLGGAMGQSTRSTTLTAAPTGVWGDTNGPGTGVLGTADLGDAIEGFNNSDTVATLVAANATTSSTGVVLEAFGDSFGGKCTIDVSGNLKCTGSKSAVVPVDGGSHKVALYAVEAPENWFEDAGSGQLSNGSAIVTLEPTFSQTVNTGMDYHVFLTPNGDCNGLFVAQKTPASFVVRELAGGTSSIAFDFRIMARRKGYEDIRLADMTGQFQDKSPANSSRNTALNSAMLIQRYGAESETPAQPVVLPMPAQPVVLPTPARPVVLTTPARPAVLTTPARPAVLTTPARPAAGVGKPTSNPQPPTKTAPK